MTDTDDQNQGEQRPPDWARLANQALDLWQDHLSSLASDPKAKEDMARLMTPMTQMCAGWMDMMQQGLRDMNAYPEAAPHAEQPVSPSPAARDEGSDGSVARSEPPVAVAPEPVAPEPIEPAPVAAAPIEPAGERSFTPYPELPDLPELAARPAPAPLAVEQAAPVEPSRDAATRGRAASADSAHDLARLAGRLAELERELEGMRAKNKRRDGEPDADRTGSGHDQCVAGPASSGTSG